MISIPFYVPCFLCSVFFFVGVITGMLILYAKVKKEFNFKDKKTQNKPFKVDTRDGYDWIDWEKK